MNSGLGDPAFRKHPAGSKMNALRQGACLVMSLCIFSSAHAVKQGHARLVSLPGNPLEIVLPITALSPEDQQALKVQVAEQMLWSQAGLTPPVPLAALRVTMQPGARPDTRNIVVQSSQTSKQSVVDVLLTLSTASGSRQMQVSLLQPDFAQPSLAVGSSSIRVQSGDTLYAIAQRNMVPGATIHQMLWALYEGNPSAFISDNMNLLRAGAVLNIPDAKTVLAIDPAMARSRFAEHDARFRAMRGQRVAVAGQPPVVGAATASSGRVSPPSNASAQQQPSEDRLRLSTSDKDKQADLQVSQKREMAEHQARVGELQQNIQQMKEALSSGPGSKDAVHANAQTGLASSPSAGSASTTPGAGSGANATGTAANTPGALTSAAVTAGSTISSGAANATNAVSGNPSSALSGSPASAGPGNSASLASAGAIGAGASSATSQPSQAAVQQAATPSEIKEGDVLTHWMKDNLLVVITGLLALLAFLIGMRMRRHSSRRDDESDDPDAGEQVSPAAKSAFEKKLQSIDLNLDSVDTPTKADKPPKSS